MVTIEIEISKREFIGLCLAIVQGHAANMNIYVNINTGEIFAGDWQCACQPHAIRIGDTWYVTLATDDIFADGADLAVECWMNANRYWKKVAATAGKSASRENRKVFVKFVD